MSPNYQHSFHLQLFLLHMDDITPNATNQRNGVDQPIGCSTICVNNQDCVGVILLLKLHLSAIIINANAMGCRFRRF